MKLSVIFEDKPERWGYRGDPYFWDYLKEKAEEMELITPELLEIWIKDEHFALSGIELTEESTAVVDRFAHGGMSSGGIAGDWWCAVGIPLLKDRLKRV